MSKGIVVDHKESHVRFAISERNFNEKLHTKVRDLKAGETVIGFTPKRKSAAVVESSYIGLTVAELQAQIDTRNAELHEDDQITPASRVKADLIAALEQDDEFSTDN